MPLTGRLPLAVSIGTAHGYYNELNGKFMPVDKFMDPVTDECAAHISRLIRFFAGK